MVSMTSLGTITRFSLVRSQFAADDGLVLSQDSTDFRGVCWLCKERKSGMGRFE